MPEVFVDAVANEELLRTGFVKLPLLSESQVASLVDDFAALRPDDGFAPTGNEPTNSRTYHCTFLDTSTSYRLAVDTMVHDHFAPLIKEVLVDYELLIGNAYVKPPGRGEFEVHQNWNITTDPRDITLTLWVPLHDTDAANGTLRVVPGSHKIIDTIAVPRQPYFFQDIVDTVEREFLEDIEVTVGDVVFFDDNLIHGSDVNRSDTARVALQIEAVPRTATPAIHLPDEHGLLLVEARRDFYLTSSLADIDNWPTSCRLLGTRRDPNRCIDEAEFRERLIAGDRIRAELFDGPGPPPS